MRTLAVALVTGLAILALSSNVQAQCGLFQREAKCAPTSTSPLVVDFRLPGGAVLPGRSGRPAVVSRVATNRDPQVQGNDCAMVKPVDPDFRSNMPIVRPDPWVKLPMRVIPAPPCKR